MADVLTLKLEDVKWREDLYPRMEADPKTIQRYAEDLDVLPPVEVNQHHELIDGYHRWTAHKQAKASTIRATVTETRSDVALLALACERNAKHGLQLAERDKRKMAIRLFADGTGLDKATIRSTLSIPERTLTRYLEDVEKRLEEERMETLRALWLACYTQEEIAAAVPDRTEKWVGHNAGELLQMANWPDGGKVASYEESGWEPPLYDHWAPRSNKNEVSHFGNTPVEFVDNLLYTFTQPFDIVIDPFAGGGSTIDVCKRRLRRYWVSDRKPIPAREREIRQHDVVTDGVTGPFHWGDVALVYLDPPYWKQAENEYSDDPTDLGNMPLDEFTDALVGVIHGYAAKLKPGAHIACIISPTQWPNEDHEAVYHDLDLARLAKKKLKLVRRVFCPYSTQQYNGTQVKIAKEQRLWLTLSRTLTVWERAE